MRTFHRSNLRLVLGAIALLVCHGAWNGAAADSPANLLPRDPAAWLNSPPLTTESLRGKGVVLWFFEETCPRCREKWPAIYELAKKHEGQPVVFIAVNSGNSTPAVQQYAREVKLTWPIIVDPTRQFEKVWLDQQISLQNIHQCKLILPSGKKAAGQWNDLDSSVQRALEGASWKVDPKTIPAAFLPTWQAVELGNYAAASGMLKKGLVTKNPEVKEAATRVNAYVQGQMQAAVSEANAARQAGDTWQAYKQYTAVGVTFAGYDLPADVTAAPKELASDAKVKQQLEAAKSLDSIRKSFATAKTEVAQKRAMGRLEQFITQHAGTDAAAEAQQLLRDASGQP